MTVSVGGRTGNERHAWKTLFIQAHVKPHLAVLRALSKDTQTVGHTQDGAVKIHRVIIFQMQAAGIRNEVRINTFNSKMMMMNPYGWAQLL